jgi:hypothetical protein
MKTLFARWIITLSSCLIIVVALVLLSCKHEDEIIPEKYEWVVSSLTPTDVGIIYLKAGPDGALYGFGIDGLILKIAKFEKGAWETMAELPASAWDFTILNDTVYYSTSTGIRRARNDFDEQLLEGRLGNLETYNDKVFIAGTQFLYQGAFYSIIAYDGKSFQPIDQVGQSSIMKRVGKKLFIAGNPTQVYDGTNLSATESSGRFLNIDDEEAIYSWVSPIESRVVINKMVNGKLENVGENIKENISVQSLEFYKNTIIVAGFTIPSYKGVTYYLDSDNEWRPIKTEFAINQLINVDGEVYGKTDTRRIVHLLQKQ